MTGAGAATPPGRGPALSIRRLSKRFGGALALDQVELEVLPGEVHGLLGQNGSGKSTLIKVLAGFHEPEPGAELTIHGDPVPLPIQAGSARRLGLAFVHQHLGLVPSLSVLENLRIGAFATEVRWYVDWRHEREAARATFARVGLAIEPDARVGDLPQVERALVAIVRAFEDIRQRGDTTHGGILVLDEPTPFLPKVGVDQLFTLVRNIVREGASVIFVSHDVDEVMEITDRATVLRDGRVAGTLTTADATPAQFVEMIVGKRVHRFQAQREDMATNPVAVRVRGLSGGSLENVSIDLRDGEIVGLTGLIGSGFDEVLYLLYGAERATAGTLTLAGREHGLSDMSPSRALGLGIPLLPADRLGAAGVGALPVTDNVTLPVLERFVSRFRLDWRRMHTHTRALGSTYDVRPNQPSMKLGLLSGGNQQKVLIAKWLQMRPRLFLLDEPTQGVDVGARQHLLVALAEAARRGTPILCASTDYEQLAQICNRVLIFARGHVIRELVGAEVMKDTIAEQCVRSLSVAGLANGEEAAPA